MELSTEQLNEARELMAGALDFHQAGELDQAKKLYCRVVELIPEFTLAHFNLGRIYFAENNFARAVYHYKEAAAQQPDDPDILFNLALSLKKSGDFSEAAALYSRILTLTPQDPEIHYNLALTNQARHEYDKAIAGYRRAVALDPDYGPAHNNLGFLLQRQGRLAEAVPVYEKLIALNHNAASARHMLAAIQGKSTPGAPPEYVREVFDSYSASYDNSLVNELEYDTPARLRALLLEEIKEGEKTFAHCLDLGCGTGLSGAAFAGLCRKVTGIDLSGGMLKLAAEKNIYHGLHQGEIVEFLHNCRESYDFFLATDVFVYLGDLAPVFAAVRERSRAGAVFLFSTEKAESGYLLQPSGRYGHGVDYIEDLSRKYGFLIKRRQETNIRKERGEWIRGNLFFLAVNCQSFPPCLRCGAQPGPAESC